MKSKKAIFILGSISLLAVGCAVIPKAIRYASGAIYKASCKGVGNDPFKDAVVERKSKPLK